MYNGFDSLSSKDLLSLNVLNCGWTKLVVIEMILVCESGSDSHVRSSRLKLSLQGSFLSRISSTKKSKRRSVYLLVRWWCSEWHSAAVMFNLPVWNNYKSPCSSSRSMSDAQFSYLLYVFITLYKSIFCVLLFILYNRSYSHLSVLESGVALFFFFSFNTPMIKSSSTCNSGSICATWSGWSGFLGAAS